jgi:hypothetical protein
MGALIADLMLDVSACQRSYYWDWLFSPNAPNWALVIVGVAGVIAAIWTLKILGRQTKATEIAADAAKVSADALIASERAWVMVDLEKQDDGALIVDGMGGWGPHTSACVRCICSNQGKTPAQIREKRICLFVTSASKTLPKKPNFDDGIINTQPHDLWPGQQSLPDWPEGIRGNGHAASDDMIVVYGVVKYRHMFSESEVQTTFGYRIRGGDSIERLTGYPEYNKIT